MMRRRMLAVGLAIMVAAGTAGAAYSQRRPLERAWVEYRRAAIEAEALALLVGAMEHPDKFVRIDAAGYLARVGDPRSFGVLQRGVQDANPVARHSAVWRLVPFEDRALPILEQLLYTDDQSLVRDRVVEALGAMQSDAAHALLRRAWDERLPVQRTKLMETMCAAIPSEAAAILMQEMAHPTNLSRQEASLLWLRHRRRLTTHLSTAQRDANDAIVWMYIATPEFAAAVGPHMAAQSREDVTRAMARTRERDRIRALPPGEQAEAYHAMQQRRMAEDVPLAFDPEALAAELGHAERDQRLATAQRLAGAPTAAVIAAVDARLPHEPSGQVREALLRLLMAEAPDRAVPHLNAALRSRDFVPRADAAKLVRKHPDPMLVPAYEVGLESEFGYVRLATVQALNDVAHPDRRRLLARSLRDPDLEIRLHAAGGLVLPW